MDDATLKHIVAGLGEEALHKLAALIEDSLFDAAKGIAEARAASGYVCPRCNSSRTRRHGMDAKGAQRFRCNSCHRTFKLTTGSIFHRCRKIDKLKQYLGEILARSSVRTAAYRCGIGKNTSFAWRHKVLDALRRGEASKKMFGITEADETFLPLSFKGNHSPSGDGRGMPRPPKRRGTPASKRGISDEQVCIPCAVDRHNTTFGIVACLGRLSREAVSAAIGEVIDRATYLCTDGLRVYEAAAQKETSIVRLKRGRRRVIDGIYHIQTVNSFHSGFKLFLAPFRGISTKHSNNYIAWASWLRENSRPTRERLNRRLAEAFCFTRRIDIPARSAIPILA